MSELVRLRCPICGMLVNQNRLDGEYEFELVIQQIVSKGRGRITNTYYHPDNEEGTWIFKLALIDKLEAVIRDLKDQVWEDKDEIRAALWADGEYGEAFEVSGTHHAEFDQISGTVHRTLKGFLSRTVLVEAPPVLVGEADDNRVRAAQDQVLVSETMLDPVIPDIQVETWEDDRKILHESRSELRDRARRISFGSAALTKGVVDRTVLSVESEKGDDGNDEVAFSSGSQLEEEEW